MIPGDPPNLAEVKIRAEIEEEVRAEYAAREALEGLAQRDKRVLALAISGTLCTLVVCPLLGAAVGLGVRVFYLVSGL